MITSLKSLQKIYNVKLQEFNERLKYFNSILGLAEFWQQPIRKLSLGQRAKAEICASLLHNPRLLILDEPFLGLDFITKRNIIKLLKEIISKQNKTLLLVSHNITDIEALCKKIVVLDKGKILFNGIISELKNKTSIYSHITIERNNSNELKINPKYYEDISVGSEGNIFTIKILNNNKTQNIISDIINNNSDIIDIKIDKEPLEDIVIQLIKQLQ